jgi:hypothetical protein
MAGALLNKTPAQQFFVLRVATQIVFSTAENLLGNRVRGHTKAFVDLTTRLAQHLLFDWLVCCAPQSILVNKVSKSIEETS